MRRLRILLLALPLALLAPELRAQDSDSTSISVSEEHYRLYGAGGVVLAWSDLRELIMEANVVLVGEQHNDPVAHHIELAVLREVLADSVRPGVLSLEMFSRDVQHVVDEYLKDLITERHFRSASRPWGNYESDYRPLVEAARLAGAPVLAANAPRRYVNLVNREGPEALDALSEAARAWLAPLPFAAASDAYKAEFDGLMGDMVSSDTTGSGHDALASMLSAQSLWDATMAFSIAEHLLQQPDARVVHAAGSFHVANGTGIAEHLTRYRPGVRILSIVVEPLLDVSLYDPDEHDGLADVVILADMTLPRTYTPSFE
ncbi:MAG: ChaN family lipoprotein [Rhodothermales bacterium]|nr:ChaN family lipoprotein [Rhodothermales bacterium]